MRFVIVDSSTDIGNDPAYGGPITSPIGIQMAYGLDVQLNRDVASFWGGAYSVRAGAGPEDIHPGEVACALLDSLPNVPGAVAYHDVNGQEVPVIFLSRTSCSSILTGSSSVSSALSHELCETAGDPYVNAWRDSVDGFEYAQELCDAVQEASYDIEGVSCSDFVLPAFFAPGAQGPYSFLGTIGAPFAIMDGGYQLRRSSGGGETQVHGDIGDERMARKRHFASRTYRRGARL